MPNLLHSEDSQMTQNKKIMRNEFSIIGFALCVMMISTQGVAYLLSFSIKHFASPDFISKYHEIFNYILNFVPLYFVGLPIFLYLSKRIKSQPIIKSQQKKMGFVSFIAIIPTMLALTYITNFISIFITNIISRFTGSPVVNPVTDVLQGNLFGQILFVAIIAPILEEIVFRGILINKFRKYGNGIAIFGSAFAFGLFHANLSQMLYSFSVGLLLGLIAVKTGKIIYTIILHAIINFWSGILSSQILLNENINISIKMAFTMLILILFLSGIVIGINSIKKIKLALKSPSNTEFSAKQQIKTFLVSPGVIVYVAMILLMIILSLAL